MFAAGYRDDAKTKRPAKRVRGPRSIMAGAGRAPMPAIDQSGGKLIAQPLAISQAHISSRQGWVSPGLLVRQA